MDLFSGYSISENKECHSPCAPGRTCYRTQYSCKAASAAQHVIQMDSLPHALDDTFGGGSKAKRKRKIKNSRHNTTKRKTTKRKTTKRKKRSKQH